MASRVEQFTALVAGQSDNALFRFSLAQALTAEGRVAEAIPHFEKCVASRADWMMPRVLLGKLLLQLGRTSVSLRGLRDGLHCRARFWTIFR